MCGGRAHSPKVHAGALVHAWLRVSRGGLSTSTWDVNVRRGTAVFNGTVALVPSLKAPGFCQVYTSNGAGIVPIFADVSRNSHLMLRVRSRTPTYPGFKVSFAANTFNPIFASFKASFALMPTEDWQTVSLLFRPEFSKDWSPFTGDCDTVDPTGTRHRCCTKDNLDVCPSNKNLRSISQLGLWAEGHAGDFHLEVSAIGAGYGPSENRLSRAQSNATRRS